MRSLVLICPSLFRPFYNSALSFRASANLPALLRTPLPLLEISLFQTLYPFALLPTAMRLVLREFHPSPQHVLNKSTDAPQIKSAPAVACLLWKDLR